MKGLLCDLDGTLVQSVGEIISAMNDTLSTLGFDELSDKFIRDHVGLGTAWLTEQCLSESSGRLIDRNTELFKEIHSHFLSQYAKIAGTRSTLFDGVFDVIIAAKEAGMKIGVVTNKGRDLAERVLDGHALLDQIDTLVAGGDTKLAKPHAEPLQHALKQLGLSAEEAIFVGDSSHDIEAARNANMAVWAMSYGYNHGEDVASSKPDRLFHQFKQVADELGLTIVSTNRPHV